MSNYYKLGGREGDSSTVWTTEVVLEVNDQGDPTKVVRVGEPVQLSGDEKEKLESLGFVVESSSASEAKEAEESAQQVGGDITGSAPVLGAGQNQETEQRSSKGDRK